MELEVHWAGQAEQRVGQLYQNERGGWCFLHTTRLGAQADVSFRPFTCRIPLQEQFARPLAWFVSGHTPRLVGRASHAASFRVTGNPMEQGHRFTQTFLPGRPENGRTRVPACDGRSGFQ